MTPSAQPAISGTTRLYAVLADPVAQVKAPQFLNARLAATGEDAVMIAVHVDAAGLPAMLVALRAMRNFAGAIVTVPHKQAVVTHLDALSDRARLTGACNVIRRELDGRLIGDCLDGIGFVAGLRQQGIEPSGLAVYLVGAGGAASAIAFALAEAGVASLTIANRSVAKADALRKRLTRAFPNLPISIGSRDPSGHALVVNATSLGLRDDDVLPLDTDRLERGSIVAEIIMQPAVTPLLALAAARGCRTHPGTPMLLCQINLMAQFMGMTPDVRD